MRNSPRNSKKASLLPIPVEDAFDKVAVDVLGPIPPSSKGSRYIVVFSDYLTRWVEAFPVSSVQATVIARSLVDEIILDVGHHVCCFLTGELTFYLKSLQKFVIYFKFKRSILPVITHRPMVL